LAFPLLHYRFGEQANHHCTKAMKATYIGNPPHYLRGIYDDVFQSPLFSLITISFKNFEKLIERLFSVPDNFKMAHIP